MPDRRPIDSRPGPTPEIRADGDSLIFEFNLTGSEHGWRLVVRCDDHGNAWARIISDPEPAGGHPNR